MSGLGQFWKAVFKAPHTVGAVLPATKTLAETMLLHTGIEGANMVVELGPGTGVITREIRNKMTAGTGYLGIERSPDLTEFLRKKFPDLVFANDSAEKLSSVLAPYGGKADLVVSSLPWALFSYQLQRDILRVVHDCLTREGVFITYAFVPGLLSPSAWKFHSLLHQEFRLVTRTSIVWKSVPPAFFYRCQL